MAYNYGNIVLARECLEQIVCKALCGHANDVLVHTVGTHAHDATQTTCSKLQVLIESIDKGGLVLVVEHCLYCVSSLLVKSRREPCLCFCLTLGNKFYIVSHYSILLIRFLRLSFAKIQKKYIFNDLFEKKMFEPNIFQKVSNRAATQY